MHYRLLIGFYGGMFIVSLGLGYAFELFDALPSWITGWSNEASLWALIAASFSAALMLWHIYAKLVREASPSAI